MYIVEKLSSREQLLPDTTTDWAPIRFDTNLILQTENFMLYLHIVATAQASCTVNTFVNNSKYGISLARTGFWLDQNKTLIFSLHT